MTSDHMSRRRFATLTGSAAAAAIAGSAAGPAGAPAHEGGRIPPVVRRWATAWNTGDSELMASLFTADGTYVDRAFEASFQGPKAIAQWVVITLDSITDARATIHDAFQAGRRAAARWTFSGTFTTIEPFPPTSDPRGKSFSVPAVSYFTLARGRIASVEDVYNLTDLMRQLGIPVPYTPPQP